MRGITRRDFIGTAVAGGAGALLLPRWAGATTTQLGSGGPALIPAAPFTLGVASGDPTSTSVILWTRLAPDPLNGGGMGAADEPVDWEVATDAGFADVVASGTATATAAYAHSVHVDATGLDPDSWYFYRFAAGGYDSPVGRTRTLPPSESSPTGMTFGFASCQAWTSGYYTAHTHLAAEPLDLVFFLGDFIYEGGGTGVRPHNGGEVKTLPEYRNRYALYTGDGELQKSRAAFPWVAVWDDHEVDNNYAGVTTEDGVPVPQFLIRRAAAYQAWWEHQPVRLAPPVGPDLPIYRGFAWGDLANFYALDTRQYRDAQACPPTPGLGDIGLPCDAMNDPNRTIMGADQETWLLGALGGSSSIWNVLAQQVVFSAMPIVGSYNFDQWDGYPVSRQRIVDVLARPEVRNPLVVTGDIHLGAVADVHLVGEDPTSPRVATELVGTSISSNFNADLVDIAEALIGGLEWVHYANTHDRGYVTVALSRDRMDAAHRVVSTVTEPTATAATRFTWSVEAEDEVPTSTTTTTSVPTTAGPAVAAQATPTFSG